ncbi:hypothetical protein WSS15_15590 [Acetobacter pasteurianus]|uniref:RusA family crossover junction endodeoxyribonuclease n=1 Tax=Acetobacter pasteurianus TaxID=438 RepID=UPI0022CA0755|nr:RusA family crossover junction endodeoxyribonuclease [Acetobacter pasteurianus]GLH28909.1 hypothetical protein WSS15_15590 [Acetobacter pasteurianus]
MVRWTEADLERYLSNAQKTQRSASATTLHASVQSDNVATKSASLKKHKRSRHPVLTESKTKLPFVKAFLPLVPKPKARARTFMKQEANAWVNVDGEGSGGPIMKMKSITPTATREYEKMIHNLTYGAMLEAGIKPYDVPLFKGTIFYIPGQNDEWPTSIRDGDLDNLEKALYDGMNKVVFSDDKLIVAEIHAKVCSERPGVEMLIRPALKCDVDNMRKSIGFL